MPDSDAPAASGPETKTGRPIFGDYQVEGELGRGGMGVVFRARQKKLNRLVALKMLTGHFGPDELARFRAEAETAAGLHHTNIVQIYEVGEDQGLTFYSMEHIESGSLADRLRKGPMPDRETAALLIAVGRALHFAHQNGVVHRDMKPANILLDPEGVPKVTDFGIAKRLSGDSALTVTGAVIGTPTYMAPEQAKGTSREVGATADVYSLGAILYEMLAGRPPFLPEDSETAITVRVITEDPVSPAWHRPDIPRDLETICMKCLEKEPRDRYSSAAAFAEDLRRYLDDESIVARPPTRLVRTTKWIRRHPWRFVTGTAVVLALVFAGWRLWQWEFYQRSHLEYALGFGYRDGGAEPFGIISAPNLSHRAVSLRFTRRGRWGPIVRVESINARQYPSNVSQFFNYEPLPNWIEGFGSVTDPKKTRETTQIDFVHYQDGMVSEVIAHNCNGPLTWHLVYDRASVTNPNRIHARFVTSRGFDFASRGGASLIEFERDAAGRETRAMFFSGSGQPAANGEGVFGYAMERDGDGHLIRLTNLDKEGKPAANRAGQVVLAFQINPRGLAKRTDFLNGAGEPAPCQGISAITNEYDDKGDLIEQTRCDATGRKTNGDPSDWAVQKLVRNDRGEIVELRFYSADSNEKLNLMGTKTFGYDEHGYPADIRFDGRNKWRTAVKCDERGNVLEERILGRDGQPMAGAEGWAIHRHAWKFSPDGFQEEETWFDVNDAPAYTKGGEHRRISEFDAAGILSRFITEEHDPARFHYQRYVCEPQYDAQGRERRTIVRYQDANGQPATNAGLLFTTREVTMNEDEREILEWKLGCDVKALGSPVIRTDTEWHRTGTEKRIVRLACDENRQPLGLVSNGTAARSEKDYDEIGRLERIHETGFDEKLIGFSVREARFSQGTLQSVTHQRGDGTMVESVRVIITGVEPEQAKAAELRVGDQLLAGNGNPVLSAYHWVANTFPGGWIEVLRDGQKIRIEGFEAGSIGITLEDRAR